MAFREITGNYKDGNAAKYISKWPASLVIDEQNQNIYLQNAVSPGLLLANTFKIVTRLSSIQLLNAYTNPVLLVPAPGAGYITILQAACYVYLFNTVAYANDSGQIWYSNGDGGFSLSADSGDGQIFTSTLSQFVQSVPYSGYEGSPFETDLTENQGLYFWPSSGNLTSGDGTATITVFYNIVQMF